MTSDEFKIKVFSLKDQLYRFSKHIVNDAVEAEDVVQEVLIKLWKMRDDLGKYKSLEALAMTATKNLSLDKARRKTTKIQKAESIAYEVDTINEGDHLEYQEMGNLIRKAIQNLKEPQKTIMYLRDIEGYEYDEIENLVAMNVQTIRVNLSRARKRVREEIKKVMSYGLTNC